MKQTKTLTHSTSYSLSLRIDPDGFSLSVYDKSDTLLTAKKIEIQLSDLSAEQIVDLINTETQLNFENIRITIESDNYVIIPLELFNIEEAADYLFLEHKPAKTDSILFNKIPECGIVNVFVVSWKIHAALNHLFPNAEINHHLSQFISDEVKFKGESCVYCWIRSKMLDIIALKAGKLQLINSFSYQTPEDFLYFTLNVYEKLSIDMHKSPLFLYNVDKKLEIKTLLEKYLKVNSL
jgi:hypothetical protein